MAELNALDEDSRTTAIGLFNYADSYWMAAEALRPEDFKTTHPDAPKVFLYCQAIELYLKSFLRLRGHTVRELRQSFGHDLTHLGEAAVLHGLPLQELECAILHFIDETYAAIRARYIVTGFTQKLPADKWRHICETLRRLIEAQFRDARQPVRPLR
jgi:hypothetical protein